MRPYLARMIRDLDYAWLKAAADPTYRRVTVQMPTGAGKTHLAAEVVSRFVKRDRPALYIVPTTEILEQTEDKLRRVGVVPAILKAGKHPDLHNVQCVLAMSQTLARRTELDWDPSLVVVDEIHRLIDQHKAVVKRWPAAWVMGMSATPCRLDGKPLADVTPYLVTGPTIRELQESGYLVPCRAWASGGVDMAGVRVRAGDFDSVELERRFLAAAVDDVPRQYVRAVGRRRTLCFASGIAHSKALCRAFRDHGIPAEHVDGTTAPALRDAAIARLRSGKTEALCNVGLFVEGLDVVETEGVILATATMSLSRYMQMVGRGLRISPETRKRQLAVLDLGGNWARHGAVDADRDWSREGRLVG